MALNYLSSRRFRYGRQIETNEREGALANALPKRVAAGWRKIWRLCAGSIVYPNSSLNLWMQDRNPSSKSPLSGR